MSRDQISVALSPPNVGIGFRSILFGALDAPDGVDDAPQPECFIDLNLDQVVAAVIAPKPSYRLLGYFHAPMDDIEEIRNRQKVFQDLERLEVYEAISRFAAGMHTMRVSLERMARSRYTLQRQRWFLDAVTVYCAGIQGIMHDLGTAQPQSAGLRGLCEYLDRYCRSTGFVTLAEEASAVAQGLGAIKYDVWVHGSRVTVGAFDDESDYSAEVATTFERFRQHDIQVRPPERAGHHVSSAVGPRRVRDADDFMGHVEGQILDRVAKVFPTAFAELSRFCQSHADYLDQTVAVFDREIQFYVAYLDHIAILRRAGLSMTYPHISSEDKSENAMQTFDIALAWHLLSKANVVGNPVVCNDIHLADSERILVVSGPNNGGKTTLARTVGQLHYLAKLGCPVPGREVQLFLVDQIYTHFEKREDLATLAGKLQEELDRMRADFERATPRSLMIMNEMFSSTTVYDALFLSKQMLGRVSALDALGVCVTFLEELATLNDKTVSMVSTVDPTDLARRTFEVVRKSADGKAYAQALAQKYGLTYDALEGRVRS